MRKLASVQRVEEVAPIPGADAVEVARVLGWRVVVRKGEFRPGDPVVYCEVDSLLPVRPEFEFLRASSYKPARADPCGGPGMPEGFRIKTAKIRGQVSQGICFPPSVLPPGAPSGLGSDVTDALGVLKYEPPPPVGMSGRVKGAFPGFVPRTDETRIQAVPDLLPAYAGLPFRVTEKLDGTSVTAFVRGGEFGLCSRNLWLDESDDSHVLVRAAKACGLEGKLRAGREALGFDLAVQAEAVGPGIQKNRYGLPSVELRVFTVFDVTHSERLTPGEASAACALMGLAEVPQLGDHPLPGSVDELVAFSQAPSLLGPRPTPREGVVWRCTKARYSDRLGGYLSFKVISPAYLLKYDE